MERHTNRLVSANYYHPEAYPPTLNAINELSRIMDSITLVYRPHLSDSWRYGKNVRLVPSDRQMSTREQGSASALKKSGYFLYLPGTFIVFVERISRESYCFTIHLHYLQIASFVLLYFSHISFGIIIMKLMKPIASEYFLLAGLQP